MPPSSPPFTPLVGIYGCSAFGYLVSPTSTWASAETYCNGQGGFLASIHSASENAVAIDFMKVFTTSTYPWIGGSNVNSINTWSDGSEWDYDPGGWTIDAPHSHFYRTGAWGTHTATATAQGICRICYPPAGATTRELFLTPVLTWDSAQAHCVTNGGNLVSIHSAEDNAEVVAYMQTHTSTSSPYPWIGSSNDGTTNAWIDGGPAQLPPSPTPTQSSPHGPQTPSTHVPGLYTCAGTAFDYNPGGWSIDDPKGHLYRSNGAWGTHTATATQEGICAKWS